MRYIPHTTADVSEMLERIGVKNLEELFIEVPGSVRLKRPLDLPEAVSETELLRELNLNYNKARQAAITSELLEIVSGAEALKG